MDISGFTDVLLSSKKRLKQETARAKQTLSSHVAFEVDEMRGKFPFLLIP